MIPRSQTSLLVSCLTVAVTFGSWTTKSSHKSQLILKSLIHTQQSHEYHNYYLNLVPTEGLSLKSSPHTQFLCIFCNCLFWTKNFALVLPSPMVNVIVSSQRKYKGPAPHVRTCSPTLHTHATPHQFKRSLVWHWNTIPCTILHNRLRLVNLGIWLLFEKANFAVENFIVELDQIVGSIILQSYPSHTYPMIFRVILTNYKTLRPSKLVTLFTPTFFTINRAVVQDRTPILNWEFALPCTSHFCVVPFPYFDREIKPHICG